jgi:hypothetical protein
MSSQISPQLLMGPYSKVVYKLPTFKMLELQLQTVYAGDTCSHGLQEMTVHCYGSPES